MMRIVSKMPSKYFVWWLPYLTITSVYLVSVTSDVATSFKSNTPLMWCSIVDGYLAGHINSITTTKTHKLCWNACKAEPKCISVNFATENGRCELNNASHHNADGLVSQLGWIYTYAQLQPPQSIGCWSHQSVTALANKQNEVNPGWPVGTYGLPMPTDGCPVNAGFTWKTGYRLHDTENTNTPNNLWSDVLHLKGPYAKNDMWQHFCMKTVYHVTDCDITWPEGEYCVFQYGDNCPSSMSSGAIFWDDEDDDNHNEVNGTVPTGEYTQDTLINFCCMTGGNVSKPISLPTDSPFYLFASSAQCQTVLGMTITREFFRWDNQDDNNRDYRHGSHPYDTGNTMNHKLHYCYYTAV